MPQILYRNSESVGVQRDSNEIHEAAQFDTLAGFDFPSRPAYFGFFGFRREDESYSPTTADLNCSFVDGINSLHDDGERDSIEKLSCVDSVR